MEYTQEKRLRTVAEIIDPRTNPGVAFQSYEEFKNNADAQKVSFLKGEIRNPEPEYPHLEDLSRMDQGIADLHAVVQQVGEVELNKEKADIISTTLEFRIAEMEFVKLSGELDAAVKRRDPEEYVQERAEKFRVLNEQLYGKTDEELLKSAQNEVWSQLDAKRLSPSAKELYDELVVMLPRPEKARELPDFNSESLKWAGEIVLTEFADVESYFTAFWDEKTAAYGDDWVAQPEDIIEAFEGALAILDPERKSGIGAQLDPEASAASWETSLMVIKIGGKRAPIKNPEALFKLFMHEGGVHGTRAIYGLETNMAVLGTGLFTNTQPADYLAGEEGFAKLVEDMVSTTDQQWGAANLGHYINIGLAENGADFRDVFEAAWRYRLLLDIKDDEAVTEAMTTKAQGAAYTGAVRIFRGTPMRLNEYYPGIRPLFFSKDSAYLSGSARQKQYMEELYEAKDASGLMQLFTAKYDPTIPEQVAIVAKYGKKWESRHAS